MASLGNGPGSPLRVPGPMAAGAASTEEAMRFVGEGGSFASPPGSMVLGDGSLELESGSAGRLGLASGIGGAGAFVAAGKSDGGLSGQPSLSTLPMRSSLGLVSPLPSQSGLSRLSGSMDGGAAGGLAASRSVPVLHGRRLDTFGARLRVSSDGLGGVGSGSLVLGSSVTSGVAQTLTPDGLLRAAPVDPETRATTADEGLRRAPSPPEPWGRSRSGTGHMARSGAAGGAGAGTLGRSPLDGGGSQSGLGAPFYSDDSLRAPSMESLPEPAPFGLAARPGAVGVDDPEARPFFGVTPAHFRRAGGGGAVAASPLARAAPAVSSSSSSTASASASSGVGIKSVSSGTRGAVAGAPTLTMKGLEAQLKRTDAEIHRHQAEMGFLRAESEAAARRR